MCSPPLLPILLFLLLSASGTAWDELYYDSMQALDLKGKKVACFGCGDSIGYGENFCDAVDELHEVCKARGAEMFGSVSWWS